MRPSGSDQFPPTERVVTQARATQLRGAVNDPERVRKRHCVPTLRASATCTDATSERSGPATPRMARTEASRAPMRGNARRLPGATVSEPAAATAPGAGVAGRLQTVGSPAKEHTPRAGLRMSPARVAVTAWVPEPWATNAACPAASAVACAPPYRTVAPAAGAAAPSAS